MTAHRRRGVLPGLQSRPIVLIGVAYLLISTPQALNFMRVLPVLCPFFLVALYAASRSREVLKRTWLDTSLVLFIFWIALSFVWSENRVISGIQVFATTLAILVGCLAGSRVTLQTLLAGLVAGGVLVLASSLAVAVLSPSTGFQLGGYQGGSLRGIFIQRNLLAGALTPAFLAACCLSVSDKRARLFRWLALLFIAVGIVLTRSSTAFGVCVFSVTLFLGLRVLWVFPPRLRVPPFALTLGVYAVVAVWLLKNLADVFLFLGRDETLTGRVVIWRAAEQLIAAHPILGYGWGAAWGVDGYVQRYVEAQAKFTVPHAHNGYLNVMLQAGGVGLVLLLVPLLKVLTTGLKHALSSRNANVIYFVVFSAAVLLYNYSEPTLESPLIVAVLSALLASSHLLGDGRSRLALAHDGDSENDDESAREVTIP